MGFFTFLSNDPTGTEDRECFCGVVRRVAYSRYLPVRGNRDSVDIRTFVLMIRIRGLKIVMRKMESTVQRCLDFLF